MIYIIWHPVGEEDRGGLQHARHLEVKSVGGGATLNLKFLVFDVNHLTILIILRNAALLQ
jgi:hypothetical protein